MASSLDAKRDALGNFLQAYSDIKYVKPTDPDFSSLRAIYNRSFTTVPLAITRPQTADEVAALVAFCTTNAIQFTVRSGGNNLFGLSCVQDALMIDLRDIDYIKVDEGKSSVTVGGGILQAKVARELSKEGLITPLGSIGFVGFVGWSIYGGYGPLSSKYGLGLDNILAAKIVDRNGEVVVADKELLKGIRGAGGAFGVIVELTVKAYPLDQILAGMIVFESQDIATTYAQFNAGYQAALEDASLPLELNTQQFIINTPHGRAFAVGLVWSSEDHEAGREAIAKVENLGNLTVVMNTIEPKTLADHIDSVGSQLPHSAYGSCQTVNVRTLSEETAEVLGRAFAKMPSSFGTAFSAHELRGLSAKPNNESVFASREPHFMLEFISMVEREEAAEESLEWATNLKNEILQTDPENLLTGTYISITPPGDIPLSRIYGPDSNYQTLLSLKRKYDPQNAFNLAVPQLEQ